MAYWTTTPLNGETREATPLLRVKPKQPIQGIITSRALTGCYVHYYRGRTTPCEEERCEACKDNRNARWYGWVGIWSPRTHQVAIAELTPACLDPLSKYLLTHGQLRGADLTLRRANEKINSRLSATIKESTIALEHLPPELDVISILEHIWETHRGDSAGANTNATPKTQEGDKRDRSGSHE